MYNSLGVWFLFLFSRPSSRSLSVVFVLVLFHVLGELLLELLAREDELLVEDAVPGVVLPLVADPAAGGDAEDVADRADVLAEVDVADEPLRRPFVLVEVPAGDFRAVGAGVVVRQLYGADVDLGHVCVIIIGSWVSTVRRNSEFISDCVDDKRWNRLWRCWKEEKMHIEKRREVFDGSDKV